MLNFKLKSVLIFLLFNCIFIQNCYGKLLKKIPNFFSPTSAETITNCRSGCLNEFLDDFDNVLDVDRNCLIKKECLACWEYCRIIFISEFFTANALCNDRRNCSNGCKFACKQMKVKILPKNAIFR